MFFLKSKVKPKKNSLDNTLNNFLSFLLCNYQKYSNELSSQYSKAERYTFIYNCAINTIDEYITTKKYQKEIYLTTKKITTLFKENFDLKHFEPNGISEKVSPTTSKIINEFKYLKEELNNTDKNYIMKNVKDILASTT